VFTVLGPGIFWLAYPLGPFKAVFLAEMTVHSVRFFTFRIAVFPAQKGYNVNIRRYVLSALPVSLTGLACIGLFRGRLDRTALTLTCTFVTVIAGFLWSRFIYALPARNS